jgi:hypothetical protein
MNHSPHHPYSSYSSLFPAIPRLFLAESAVFAPHGPKNSAFRREMVEKRLDLTNHMSCTDAEGRGSRPPTALSIRITHIAC